MVAGAPALRRCQHFDAQPVPDAVAALAGRGAAGALRSWLAARLSALGNGGRIERSAEAAFAVIKTAPGSSTRLPRVKCASGFLSAGGALVSSADWTGWF